MACLRATSLVPFAGGVSTTFDFFADFFTVFLVMHASYARHSSLGELLFQHTVGNGGIDLFAVLFHEASHR
ncbi:MAG: hypothetical protein CFK52_15030, partial [Chloracidobacterium sp. CP2_5A]